MKVFDNIHPENHKSTLRIIIFLLILFNIGLFIYLNTQPMNWTNKERMWHGYFWSMQSMDNFNLDIGLHKGDLLKPFNDHFVDGAFRYRQVSYYLEMLFFKFWQMFNAVLIRDYSIIFLHVLNVLLIFKIIYYLCQSRRTAWITALLFLNSGVGLATLMYPFRNAKLLAMTFFLLAWLIVASSRNKIFSLSMRRLMGFFFMIVLALFTDEIAVFLIPILFFVVYLRDGFQGLTSRRFLLGVCVSMGLCLLFAFLSFRISSEVVPTTLNSKEHIKFLHQLVVYFSSPFSVIKDTFKGFFIYFIPRNFGYWDLTFWGILAVIVSAFLTFIAFFSKIVQAHKRLVLFIIGVIFIKSILLPHNSGVHHIFMPETTFFPSLFFFSYYYVYCESLLLSLVLGFLLSSTVQSHKRFVIVLGCLTVVSLSNVLHLKQGPKDALKFMYFDKEHRQKRVKEVLAIDQILSQEENLPVYLSFQAGNVLRIKGRKDDNPNLNLYQRLIPIRYLRSIMEGQAVISYENVQKEGVVRHDELSRVEGLYDVYKGEFFNLREMKKTSQEIDMTPSMIKKNSTRAKAVAVERGFERLVFFIKGYSSFVVQWNGKRVPGRQTYGYAYQKFEVDLVGDKIQIVEVIVRAHSEMDVQLVGPFLLGAKAVVNDDEALALQHKKSLLYRSEALEALKSAKSIKDIGKVISKMKEAINLNPDDIDHYLVLSRLFMKLKSYENAIFTLRGASIKFPHNNKIHEYLAVCHKAMGDNGLYFHHAEKGRQGLE